MNFFIKNFRLYLSLALFNSFAAIAMDQANGNVDQMFVNSISPGVSTIAGIGMLSSGFQLIREGYADNQKNIDLDVMTPFDGIHADDATSHAGSKNIKEEVLSKLDEKTRYHGEVEFLDSGKVPEYLEFTKHNGSAENVRKSFAEAAQKDWHVSSVHLKNPEANNKGRWGALSMIAGGALTLWGSIRVAEAYDSHRSQATRIPAKTAVDKALQLTPEIEAHTAN